MEMSPQQVRNASFKSARRGFDPDEVQAFLRDVAESLEAAQNQSTAMEARARAAVARLQEVSTTRESPTAPAISGDAETISRTLLLAQRTADVTVADAKSEADRIVSAAHAEAANTIDSTREMSARLVEEARAEARQVSEVDRKAAQSEVEALVARRDFLESDVDQLENFLVAQRDRLRQTASELLDISERVPGGLGEVRRPLLSASDDSTPPLESRPPGHAPSGADADAASETVPDPVVATMPDPLPTDEVHEPGRVGDDAGDDGPVDSASAAEESDDEPRFRFGSGETHRDE